MCVMRDKVCVYYRKLIKIKKGEKIWIGVDHDMVLGC